jgi:hypothetical protein
MELPDNHVERLLTSALDRIRAAGPSAIRSDSGWTAGEGMMLLRSLLEPICGHGTAKVTMDLAVQRSTADEPGRVTRRNWRLFVANLSGAVASVCGSAAGRLVGQAGACLAIEEG